MSDEKKLDAVTVKMSETLLRFVQFRAGQKGYESVPAYIRHLIELDRDRAASDLKLLAEGLGLKVSGENMEILKGDKC